jgi:hypothetical protein
MVSEILEGVLVITTIAITMMPETAPAAVNGAWVASSIPILLNIAGTKQNRVSEFQISIFGN